MDSVRDESQDLKQRPRARELGVIVGDLPTGPLNAITDVFGVSVGHVTLSDQAAPAENGARTICTGVTVVVPAPGNLFTSKVAAAAHVINGFGKAAGLSQLAELGTLETPIVLTNTLSVGAGMLGLVQHTLNENPGIRSVNAVAAECNDGWLNDIAALHVQPTHVLEALAASHNGKVLEGAVGAGAGMICYGWKGGIGTASRIVDAGDGSTFSVGVLLLSNFGKPSDLRIGGVHVGAELTPPTVSVSREGQTGSCVVVIATSAPADSRQLGRLARRAQTGLARTGTFGEHGSGEYAFAFSTTRRVEHEPHASVASSSTLQEGGDLMNSLFKAVVEATEEAVLNSLFAGRSVTGFRGRVITELPTDHVRDLLASRRST